MNINIFLNKFFFESPLELLLFTSFVSSLVLIPITLYTNDINQLIESFTGSLGVLYVLNGIIYHMQTFFAFTLMSYISPVTYRYDAYVKSSSFKIQFKLYSVALGREVFSQSLN